MEVPLMIEIDETHDPRRKSWVESANDAGSDFPIQNLPLGIFSTGTLLSRRFGIAIGDRIFDVGRAREHGLLHGLAALAAELGGTGTLNALFAAGHAPTRELRKQVSALLSLEGNNAQRAQALSEQLLHPMSDCHLHLPTAVGNYTDFYAGIHHARAAGALMAPDNPLPVNYKWVPIAYHGRASSVRVTGTPVRRPRGQRGLTATNAPVFGPSERLDFELEMGFYVGAGNALGEHIPIEQAAEHIVGFCLLNDWSARDIQLWEMFPLGPFLGKNFGTTVSPWVITAQALAPFRVPAMERPASDPQPLEYLRDDSDQRHGGIDVALSVQLSSEKMRAERVEPVEILHSNAMHLYWTPAQMLAHHASGGCDMTSGDLLGTGTISGPTRNQLSSLLELTFGGTEPVALPDGEQRAFLQDGDEIVFRGRCSRPGYVSIGFGSCAGRVVA
jgi:fumarylacetoacetase